MKISVIRHTYRCGPRQKVVDERRQVQQRIALRLVRIEADTDLRILVTRAMSCHTPPTVTTRPTSPAAHTTKAAARHVCVCCFFGW